MINFFDCSRHGDWIVHAHSFLSKHFDEDELESVEYYLESVSPTELPDNIFIIALESQSILENHVLPKPSEGFQIVGAAILSLLPICDTSRNPIENRVLGRNEKRVLGGYQKRV